MRAEFDSNPSWEGHEIEVDSKPKNEKTDITRPIGTKSKKIRPLYFLQL